MSLDPIGQELAETHCLNSETPLPSSGLGEPRQQGVNLSFAAIDMFAKLVVLLVKVRPETLSAFLRPKISFAIRMLGWLGLWINHSSNSRADQENVYFDH